MLSFKQALDEHMQLEMNARRVFEQSIASFSQVPEAYDELTHLRELLRHGAKSLPDVLHAAVLSLMKLKPLVQKKYPAEMPAIWRATTELNKTLNQLQPMSGIPTEELMSKMRSQPQGGGIMDFFKKKQSLNFERLADYIPNDEIELYQLIDKTEKLVPEASELCGNIKTAILHTDLPKELLTAQLKTIISLKIQEGN